jgi:hypothetical protein
VSWRPEARLLLACVAAGRGAPDLSSVAALAQSDLDWGWFVRTARLHAVLPLVHRRLVQAGVERRELRAQATAVAFRTLRLTAELVGLAREFEAAGIPMLAWKGPALAMLAWGDVALREYGDLDLVVFPEDYERASAVLLAHGHRSDTAPSGAPFRSLLRRDWHWTFTHAGAGTHIELHWRFSPGPSDLGLSLKDVWERRQMVRVTSGSLASPGSEDLLLLLTDHGARHAWERLGWIVDVARLADDSRLDWEAILRRAHSLGSERMLLLGLSVAHRLLGWEMPPAVSDRCALHPMLPVVGERVTGRLFENVPGQVGVGERWAFWLRARERKRDRVRLAAALLLGIGERDWAAVRLPERLHPLYYLFRPLRLVWRHGTRLLGAHGRR